MRKALRTSGVSAQQMADYLDVSRNTISNWINGRVTPSTQSVRLWAIRTGVPYEWLQNGVQPPPLTTPGYSHGGYTLGNKPATHPDELASRDLIAARVAA